MLEVLRALAAIGPLSIEAHRRVCFVAILVKLPGAEKGSLVRHSGEKLYPTLAGLVNLAKAEEAQLWIEHFKPKQRAIDYGQESEDKVD
jgi:hypothetical protein